MKIREITESAVGSADRFGDRDVVPAQMAIELADKLDRLMAVANGFSDRIGCGCGIDGPCDRCDEVDAEFESLKRELL